MSLIKIVIYYIIIKTSKVKYLIIYNSCMIYLVSIVNSDSENIHGILV